MTDLDREQSRAKISLGLSILFGVLAFVYFFTRGQVTAAFGIGGLLVLAGLWEYRRRHQDARAAVQYEAEAETYRDRDRQ